MYIKCEIYVNLQIDRKKCDLYKAQTKKAKFAKDLFVLNKWRNIKFHCSTLVKQKLLFSSMIHANEKHAFNLIKKNISTPFIVEINVKMLDNLKFIMI